MKISVKKTRVIIWGKNNFWNVNICLSNNQDIKLNKIYSSRSCAIRGAKRLINKFSNINSDYKDLLLKSFEIHFTTSIDIKNESGD